VDGNKLLISIGGWPHGSSARSGQPGASSVMPNTRPRAGGREAIARADGLEPATRGGPGLFGAVGKVVVLDEGPWTR